MSVLRPARLLLLLLAAACAPPETAGSLDRPSAPAVTAAAEAKATTSPAARSSTPALEPPADRAPARVTRVVDGDTVVLAGIGVGAPDRTGGRKARLIGVDTPEVYGGVECMGREASAYTRTRLDGRDVLVSFDVDPVDRYGRALVYLWEADGSFFNERIVSDGFAMPMTVPPNVRYAETFVDAARRARESGRGLWSRC